MKTTIKNLMSLILIAFMSIVFSNITEIQPLYIAIALLIGGIATYVTRVKNQSVLFEGLASEVWIPLVKQDLYPDNSFLNGANDMSALVDYDKINFAEVGADPIVMKNNTAYPIGTTVASDTPKEITLDFYDTDSTIIRNAIAIELAYDQRSIYANKHKKALIKKIGLDAAYAYAPTQNDSATKNTVLNLGANDSMIDAIIDLKKAYSKFDDDGTDRHLVLDPEHFALIAKEDKLLYKSMMVEKGATFFGFKIWEYSKNPIYTTTGVKAAQGAAFVSGTHKYSSFSFLGSEVMKAIGTIEMFSNLKDPAMKGDTFNFQMRALVSSLRGKYSGAIIKG
jgi:hypothetical protein